jgi:SulP family sulfate permease
MRIRSHEVLVPEIVPSLRGYTRSQFLTDLTSGVVVGIVALPLAVAFAIASGVTPERGLYSAIVAGFLISLLGGSRVQIGGPTGAFIVIVYGIVQTHGVEGLLVSTIMAGLILVAMGLARFGTVIKFIPFPVVTGFTSGIALVIFLGQIRDLLGLQMEEVPSEFFPRITAYAEYFPTLNLSSALVAGGCLFILIVWPRIVRRLPAPIVALVLATLAVHIFRIPVETLGDRFGAVSSTFPHPSLPDVDLAMVRDLIGPAFAIALLAGVESLMSAVVADGVLGTRHKSDMERVAQGAANIIAPLFGGIPATGGIARTATNIRNGGRTPVAGIAHALTLLAIILFFGRLASLIPFAALAAILVMVAYHMSEWRSFRAELSGPKSDVFVLLTTFSLTVLFDLVIAIEVGMVLAAFLFMRRMAEVTDVEAVMGGEPPQGDVDQATAVRGEVDGHLVPRGVEIYEIHGPFFFGAAQKFRDRVESLTRRPDVLILRMRRVPTIDSSAINALRNVVHQSRRSGSVVLIAELPQLPTRTLSRSAAIGEIGRENLFPTLEEALRKAEAVIATSKS